jgi:hypothetical protein
MNITELEGGGVRVVGFRVFSGTKKKVEPQEKHISNVFDCAVLARWHNWAA